MSFSFADFGRYRTGANNLTAAGNSQATAAAVQAQLNVFTTVPAGTGCLLPHVNASNATEIQVLNRDANALLVYPPPGGHIETQAANTPFSIPPGYSALFQCFDSQMNPGQNWTAVMEVGASASIPPSTIIATTAPTGVPLGSLWYNPTNGALYVFSGGQWLSVPATVTGGLTVGTDTAASSLTLDGPAASNRTMWLRTGVAGGTRWAISANAAPESGSNAGSDLAINRYDDTGNLLSSAVTITRSSGLVTMANGATITGGTFSGTFAGTPTWSGNNTFSSGTITLSNGTSNIINWGTSGFGLPAFTTRSAGAKLVLFPNVTGSTTDHAIGVAANTMWFSVPSSSSSQLFSFYGATTLAASISGVGVLNTMGAYQIGGTQVVGPQITGYGTPTGNSRTASFNGASATLAQTSAQLAQLIIDLKTHGLLGT